MARVLKRFAGQETILNQRRLRDDETGQNE